MERKEVQYLLREVPVVQTPEGIVWTFDVDPRNPENYCKIEFSSARVKRNGDSNKTLTLTHVHNGKKVELVPTFEHVVRFCEKAAMDIPESPVTSELKQLMDQEHLKEGQRIREERQKFMELSSRAAQIKCDSETQRW